MIARTKFRIEYCDIAYDGEQQYEGANVLDLESIARHSVFQKLPNTARLMFFWDEDLEYKKTPRRNEVHFANQQERDLAFACARELRDLQDLELIKSGHVRTEVITIGTDGDWNGTIWIGKVKSKNLEQPDFKFDVANNLLNYGRLTCREIIRNPKMIVPVAKYLGPDKCFNLPWDGLEHDFCSKWTSQGADYPQ